MGLELAFRATPTTMELIVRPSAHFIALTTHVTMECLEMELVVHAYPNIMALFVPHASATMPQIALKGLLVMACVPPVPLAVMDPSVTNFVLLAQEERVMMVSLATETALALKASTILTQLMHVFLSLCLPLSPLLALVPLLALIVALVVQNLRIVHLVASPNLSSLALLLVAQWVVLF